MSTEFRSPAEGVSFCLRGFVQHGMDAESGKQLAAALAEEVAAERAREAPPRSLGLMLPVVCWVIRDEDLALIDALWAGLTAAASVNFFQQSLTVSAITGIIAAVFKTVRRAWKKGASLGPLQYRLLLGLRRS